MNTLDLLRDLEARRILISAEGSRLRWRGPASAITPCVLAELKARKNEILALLRVEASLAKRQWDGAYPILGEWRAGVTLASEVNAQAAKLIATAFRFLDSPHAIAAAQARWSTLDVWGVGHGQAYGLVPYIASDASLTLVRIDRESALLLDRHGDAFERPRLISGLRLNPFWRSGECSAVNRNDVVRG